MSAVKNVGTWLIKSQLDIVEYKTFFIQGPVLFIPRVFEDDRGFFVETFKKNIFTEAIGLQVDFVQDNQSFSKHAGIIRGLHYQSPPHAQGKLIRCTSGSIIDIAVDARKKSPTYGQHIRLELSEENKWQFWIPTGFLHGFSTLNPDTTVMYKCTDYYIPECDGNVRWNDPDLSIDWGMDIRNTTLSKRDCQAPGFADFDNPF